MLYAIPLVIGLLLAAGLIQDYLALGALFDAAILAPTLLVAIVISVARGLLLGSGRTGIVASSYIVATVVRLEPGVGAGLSLGCHRRADRHPGR